MTTFVAPLSKLTCPDIRCHRTMLHMTDGRWACERCGIQVLFPTETQAEQITARRMDEARRFANSFPTLKAAFESWISGDAYYTQQGYRLKSNKGRVAPWSKTARKFYPDMSDFHEAAHFVFAEQCEDE